MAVEKTLVDIGTNIQAALEGDVLVLRIKTNAKGVQSKSGKSMIVASTSGFTRVGAVQVGVNVIRPNGGGE
jgi:hypothetical protein